MENNISLVQTGLKKSAEPDACVASTTKNQEQDTNVAVPCIAQELYENSLFLHELLRICIFSSTDHVIPPIRVLLALGIVLDLDLAIIYMPENKLEKLRLTLECLKSKEIWSRKDLQSCLGLLNHWTEVIPARRSLYRTLYNLLFFGLPRVGNIIPYTRNSFSLITHPTWRKVQMCNDGVILSFWVTKTIQCCERDLRIPISYSPDKPHFCVRTGLLEMRAMPGYPTGLDQPVFNVFRGGTWHPLTRSDLVKMMADHLEYLGMNPIMITPSSFRKVGMSHMLLATGNLEFLRLQGDWKSDSYKRYIIIPAEMRFSVTIHAMQFMPYVKK